MIVFPNCKINLGLQIVAKRPDGYHNLETVFYPVGWHDALEVITSHNPEISVPHLTLYGIEIQGMPQDNICFKAWTLLKNDFPQLPVVDIHLHKAIPTGAGLGGGSADGAYMLQLLNQKYQLGLSSQQLLDYSLQLGSDCPIFILNRPCYAKGRGEQLEPIALNLSGYSLWIVHPGIHVNTGWAFSKITPRPSSIDLKEVMQQPVERWKEMLFNDFEPPVFEAHPAIEGIKNQLYQNGAIYASMSGSGASVFGIFHKHTHPILAFPNQYQQHFIP